ncbi:MAG: hypothetical protein IKS20_13935, partial [Victivallales bacterium]|nr:hypothetical protein [Victivallales bacterium]
MQFSNEPFLCPRPKQIRFEDGTFSFQRNSICGKTAYPFKNKVLVRTLTSLFGKAPGPQNLQILCQPDAVKAPCNAEQAYYLDVYYEGIGILGNTEIGILYALQALM